MNIKVSEIPEEGLEVDFSKRLDSLHADARVHMTLKRISSDIFISGNVDTQVPLECGRCLDTFTQEMLIPIDLAFSADFSDEAGEFELTREDMTPGFKDDEINLDVLVDEQVLLNMPMRPLCSEDCKGLCLVCGNDLNKDDCDCSKENVDPRLQVLRKLLNKGEKE